MTAKSLDRRKRWRSQSIGFRVSPEENEQINIAVSLSGLSKKEYIANKLLDRTIKVQASCKVHRAVYDRLTEVLEELKRLDTGEPVDEELQDNISLIASIISGLYISY